MIYRGQVLRPFDQNSNKTTVLLVDFGVTDVFSLSDMYKWDNAFASMPFQAIRCIIGNIQFADPSKKAAAKLAMRRLIENKNVNVHVLYNKAELIVKVSMDGIDVAESLIQQGHAIMKLMHLPYDDAPYFPA